MQMGSDSPLEGNGSTVFFVQFDQRAWGSNSFFSPWAPTARLAAWDSAGGGAGREGVPARTAPTSGAGRSSRRDGVLLVWVCLKGAPRKRVGPPWHHLEMAPKIEEE